MSKTAAIVIRWSVRGGAGPRRAVEERIARPARARGCTRKVVENARHARVTAAWPRCRLGCSGLDENADSTDELPFYEVDLRPEGAIVRRTSRRYVSIAELAPSFHDLDRQLLTISTATSALLVDLRAIVGRNDAEFEGELGPLRRKLLTSFARAALLVRTAIGRMQLERYLASDGITARVFADEAKAMAWFLHGSPPRRG
jgi:hypothetical protein